MKKRKKAIFFFLFSVLVFCGIFYKVFLFHLVPFPGDLLVSFFFPYNSGGWEGFNPFVSHKEFISADVIRQIFPWRVLAIESFKNFQFPLWNPYEFSGSPLLANFQSAVFYPANILFLILNKNLAWFTYIFLQPILAFSFMYLFIKELNLSKYSAAFGGLAFAFIGYFISWFELGNLGHTGLWLPLVLFGFLKFYKTEKIYHLFLSSLALSFSIFGGHPQTATYVILPSFVYALTLGIAGLKNKQTKIKNMLLSFIPFVLGLCLSAVQLIPSLELLLNAPRSGNNSVIFYPYQLPLKHLVTFFAPDFFGNPATGNFWGTNYGEFMAYSGIVAIIFVFIGLFYFAKNFNVRFFGSVALISLLLALPTPLSNLIFALHIPILNSASPSRILFLTQTSLIILSAFGMETFIQNKKIKIIPIVFPALIYLGLWVFVLFAPRLFPGQTFVQYLPVAKRNLIIPTAIFGFIASIVFLRRFVKEKFMIYLFLLMVAVASFEYQYQIYKYLPFVSQSLIFPKHPLITFLQENTRPFRVYGYDRARVETNLFTYWNIFSLEGYDPLLIKRYGELFFASKKSIDGEIDRSNATLANTLPADDSSAKKFVLNITGTKFVLNKDDLATPEKPGTSLIFPSDRFNLIWQNGKYKVYENKQALPRAAIFYNWEVIDSDPKTLDTLFSKDFDYRNSLVLKEQPAVKQSSLPITSASIVKYQNNRVEVATDATSSGMLFLSDASYPGWNAYVDNKKTKAYLADYAFRAVPVEKGKHIVIFKYEPESFKLGLIVSITSFILSLFLLLRRNPVSFLKVR